MKLSKAITVFLLSLILMALVPAWKLVNYNYCNSCIQNWLGEDFITYTGRCIEVYSEPGLEGFTKYTSTEDYQDFTGQGWHLILDNGRGYYIPKRLEQEVSLCNTETLSALESRDVTVVCLPETTIPFLNLIVSLKSDDTVYVNESNTYAYLVQSMNAIPKAIGIYYAFLSPVILLEIIVLCGAIDSARNRSKKEKQKQEKMQHLREAGKLHPTKQKKKKTRQ